METANAGSVMETDLLSRVAAGGCEETEPAAAGEISETTIHQIDGLVRRLTPRQQSVLALLFGLEGDDPMTPAAIGAQLGLTPAEVLAEQRGALAALRRLDVDPGMVSEN